MPSSFLKASFRKGTDEFNAIELLLKGPEWDVPEGIAFNDKDGNPRTAARIAWWKDPSSATFPDSVIGVQATQTLPDKKIPKEVFAGFDAVHSGPVTFCGHYWLTGTPTLRTPKVGCVDYSITHKGGALCCYQWDGEKTLTEDKLCVVYRSDTLFEFPKLHRWPFEAMPTLW
jgi:hypothetical protein